jgi:RNA polymerase sigma-70 factor (ECF subfamily)
VSPDRSELLVHLPGLRRYARLLTGAAFLADDLVQDTVERAWRSGHLWPEAARLRPWLLSIMHNLFVSQVRARREYADVDLEQFAGTGDEERRAQIRLDLAGALRRLAPAHREVLLLVCVEECSYEEAAHVLGVPTGTVMSRLSRARAQVRADMEGIAVSKPALRRIK